jgi:hypothetical protein
LPINKIDICSSIASCTTRLAILSLALVAHNPNMPDKN